MNGVDTLMSLDPLSLTKDTEALDKIIAYYRNSRAREGADGRMVKSKETIDIKELVKGIHKPAAAPAPKSGLRRF